MTLELRNVTIGQQIRQLSMTVGEGQLVTLLGSAGSGKTTLLRAVLGLIPVDSGYISIDGELLTPRSAPYFRRRMAYVPQHLEVPDDYREVPTDYVQLLQRAVSSGSSLLIIDEPGQPTDADAQQTIDRLLTEAAASGAAVLAVNGRITQNQVRL